MVIGPEWWQFSGEVVQWWAFGTGKGASPGEQWAGACNCTRSSLIQHPEQRDFLATWNRSSRSRRAYRCIPRLCTPSLYTHIASRPFILSTSRDSSTRLRF